MNRRELLTTTIGTATLAVSGCTEGTDTSSGDTEESSEETDSGNETEGEQGDSGAATEDRVETPEPICETVMETSNYERQSLTFEVDFNQYIRVTISNKSGFRTRVTLTHEDEGLIFGESVESEEEQLFRVHDPGHEYGVIEELTGTWVARYEPHNDEQDTYGYAKIQVCDGAFDLEQ
ncbi:hypothetical protein [Halopenitus sp. POP-27]|uniref:hypothetical protein n=1 Tax=Halopenitus sp. POP-27 TaxID=2994425 RepID=UPI002468535E|nr:hypothetical protein [Halopenitus sp. POP-27]